MIVSSEAQEFIRRFCPEHKYCKPCSRWDCLATFKCLDCGWEGLGKDCNHDYQDDGTGEDVEPVELCLACDSDNLEAKGEAK